MKRFALFAVTAIVVVLVVAVALAERPVAERQEVRIRPGSVKLRLPDGRDLSIRLARYERNGRLSRARLRRAIERRLPPSLTVTRERARITYRLDEQGATRRALRLGLAGGRVVVPARALASTVRAPVVAQRLRNNCETAALEILLASLGRRVDQSVLLRGVARSGPLDPVGQGPNRVWGDPERGYVGRPEGGGVAGGFGVYQGPVAALARRYDRVLEDLTGRGAAAVYRRLLAGRAVMIWIGLSAGPYGSWRAPNGRRVRVNFGEHTVVLTGTRRGGALDVINPLKGTFEVWTRAQFEALWQRLGRRALAAAPA